MTDQLTDQPHRGSVARKRAARVAAVAFAASVLLIPGLAAAEEGGGGGGGGMGGPTSLVFTLTWETNDGVVHDSMPAPALAGFGAVSFNAGGQEMGTATCTQVAGCRRAHLLLREQGPRLTARPGAAQQPEGDVHRDDDRRARRLDGGSDHRRYLHRWRGMPREDGGHDGESTMVATTVAPRDHHDHARRRRARRRGRRSRRWRGRRGRRRWQRAAVLHPQRRADPGSGAPTVVPPLDAGVEAAVVTAVPVATSPTVTG